MQIDELQRLNKKFGDKIVIISINIHETEEIVKQELRKKGYLGS